MQIILDNPDNLILIPGITKNNIDTLHTKLKEYEASYEIVLYLGELGFSTKDAMLVYNFYKERVKSIIEEDIYQLIYSIPEITFKKIDRIALKNGVEKNALIACFDDNVNIDIIDEICKYTPLKVVFKDMSFKSDKDKINLEERIKKLSPETEISIL